MNLDYIIGLIVVGTVPAAGLTATVILLEAEKARVNALGRVSATSTLADSQKSIPDPVAPRGEGFNDTLL
jgi:hypothetical protein